MYFVSTTDHGHTLCAIAALVLALESLEKRSGGLTTAALSAVRTGPAPEVRLIMTSL